MRKLMSFIFVVSLLGCVDNKQSNDKPSNQTNIQNFIAVFKKTHAQWLQNSITENRTNKLFSEKLDSVLSTPDALQGYRFKLESIREYRPGKYAAQLVYDEQNQNIEIIGLLDSNLINKVTEGASYAIEGEYIENLRTVRPYYDYGMWNVHVGKNKLLDSSDVYLGVSLYKIDQLN